MEQRKLNFICKKKITPPPTPTPTPTPEPKKGSLVVSKKAIGGEKDENGNVTIYVTRIVSDENGNRFLGVENDDEWNRIKAALRALIKKEY